MLRKRIPFLRLTLLALTAIALPACDTDGPGTPGYNHAGPVTSRVVVTITSNKSTLPVGSDSYAILTVTVTNSATGQPVPDLTVVDLSSNLGSFGSFGGPNEFQVETHGGGVSVVFFPGDVLGTATIRAAALGGVGFVDIRIR